MDMSRYIEACAETGFEGIELNDGFVDTDRVALGQVKRQATVAGLDIAAVAIESVFVRNTRDEIAREKQNIIDWLERAYLLGAPMLRVNTGQPVNTLDTLADKSVTWDTVRGWVIDTYRDVVRQAENLGIVLAMENHFGATRTADDTLSVVRQVASPWLKVNIDTGNFYDDIRYGDDFAEHPEILEQAVPFEDVYEGIERLAPHMVYCHAKVYELDAEDRNDVLLDYDRIFAIFRRHAYNGYVSIENFSQEDPLDLIPRATAMLRGKLSS